MLLRNKLWQKAVITQYRYVLQALLSYCVQRYESGVNRYILFIVLIWLFSTVSASAQTLQYTNQVYRPSIKSVQCYNAVQESSFPLIKFNSGEQLTLAFDDLSSRSRSYYYTLEHCDAEWNPSRLSPAEYLQGFMEDRILDYRYSSGTVQGYIHYEVKLPNQNMSLKLPGNYLLKVYEDGDQNRPVITRRVYVAASAAALSAELVPSGNVALRTTHQKINFQVDFGGLTVQNPYADIRVVVLQNNRPETAKTNTRPALARGSQLIYNDFVSNDFSGGNEYRHFDLRTLKLNSERVVRIFKDTANAVLLLSDESRNQPGYVFNYDSNGSYFIINQDGRDARTDADYAQVYFSLITGKTETEGAIYLSGQFNDYRLDESSRLKFDAVNNRYATNLLLKQGVYDYQYVWVSRGDKRPDITQLEGSYFETENSYQLLVYYRRPGARWEELIGYRLIGK